jgi:hypothetical protein
MSPRLNRIVLTGAVALILAVSLSTTSSGQNAASYKAFLAAGANEVVVQGNGAMKIFDGVARTSSVGDLMIGVSMECALWTGTVTNAPKGGGRNASTSRAAVNVTVYVGGVPATPGEVVFCDREQEDALTFDSTDEIFNDSITLELFLRTKNANHFNFYVRNPGNGTHSVEVWVNGVNVADPNAPNGSTRAAIGKRTMVIEEFNSSN